MPSFRYLARGASRVLAGATVAGLIMLLPAFVYLVSRAPRQAFLTFSFRFVAITLLVFYLALAFWSESGWWILGPVYYVYHSVFNLFLVSLFWAFMADLYSVAESKRLFPAIAVSGTLGSIAGSMLSWQLASRIGTASLFLVAIVLLELAVWTALLRSPYLA
jgi:AAA family ATP:ADP antiporter